MVNTRIARKLRSPATPRLEWLLGAFGLVLLGSGLIFLIYQGLTQPEMPGPVVVTVTEIRDVGSAHVVRFSVRNHGSETLSNLHLAARLTDANTQIESAQVLVDYLPPHSEQDGGIYLRNDPGRYTLDIHPAGYTKP